MKEYNFIQTIINQTPIEFKRTSKNHGMVYRMENCHIQAETGLLDALVCKLDSYGVNRSDYVFDICGRYISIKFLKDSMCFKKGFYDAERDVDTIYLYQDTGW